MVLYYFDPTLLILGKKFLKSINIEVPGDPSSASFFTALTLLNNKSSLVIKNVGLNSTRIGFFKLLQKHGAKIKFQNLKKNNFEIVGDISVKSCKLRPIKASQNTMLILPTNILFCL